MHNQWKTWDVHSVAVPYCSYPLLPLSECILGTMTEKVHDPVLYVFLFRGAEVIDTVYKLNGGSFENFFTNYNFAPPPE